ncbi:MAG: peptidoglycan bridge formation glycyltransferase FemA/FemB family protein [Bacillota bacterium]|nr:peptidoglycan bridge formation glycyltransferase FemA/FemB family protein [Bacillota bacterium]
MPLLDKTNIEKVEKYNNFVRKSEFASATQDINWSLVKKDWDNEQVFIEQDGKIVAAMSLLIKRVLGNYAMIYVPRGPVCDIYNKDLVNELVLEVQPVAHKYNAFMLRFDPEVNYDKSLGEMYGELGFIVRNLGLSKDDFIQPRYNMVLDIENLDEDGVLKKFSKKTRYNIGLASRKGVIVNYYNSDEALEIFYELHEIMGKRNKIAIRPLQYFKDMRVAFGQQLRIYITEHEGDYLSAAIAISYGKKVWYIYGASSNEKRNFMPNYIMQWEMIKWALEQGATKYDFGGVFELNHSDGLYKFKEGFCYTDGATELIGEFDKVYKPLVYYSFTKLVPKVQKLRKSLNTVKCLGRGGKNEKDS